MRPKKGNRSVWKIRKWNGGKCNGNKRKNRTKIQIRCKGKILAKKTVRYRSRTVRNKKKQLKEHYVQADEQKKADKIEEETEEKRCK
jgi:hypothetical protein